jgi:tripartite-type tricarboxylate transporter receptor subunit TctC
VIARACIPRQELLHWPSALGRDVDDVMAVELNRNRSGKNMSTRVMTRRALAACVGALAALLLARDGHAQAYPERPISYIVPSSPGSSPDIVGRIMADALAKILGQPVVVLNRSGAGGTIAAATAAKAAADGYTLLQANTNHSFSQTFYKNLPYDLERDFSPIGRFASAFYVITAHPKLGVKTLPELIAKAKASPGKLNFASGGIGAATFIVMEVLKARAGIDMVDVPYAGGGPALASILSGVTEVYGSPYATAKPFIENGKLRGLAVTSAARIRFLPDMPTVAETLPGYEETTWYGLLLPAATPKAVRDKVEAAVRQAIATPETKKRFEALGYVTIDDTPGQFAKFLHEDIARMAGIIKQYNLKPE